MAFENLRKKGKAFLEFVKGEKDKEKDKEKEDPIVDKTVKVFEAQEEYEPSKEQIDLGKTEDTSTTETILDVLRKEEAEKDEKNKEEKEKSLNEKLADIEKVLETFSDKPLGKAVDPFSKTTIDIAEGPDFSRLVAKDFVSPFLITKPSSQTDRVALLYDTLKKQNLI
jgi:hypothetical protein|tara:strand:+ start:2635 stop:3138 length:504 start_codon:yes stop_codon:yes gene_type:complete